MKRRDFLKGAIISSGLLGAGLLSQPVKAAPSNSPKHRKNKFFRIDSYSHFSDEGYMELLEQLNAPPGSQPPFPPNSQRPIIGPIGSMLDVNQRLDMMDDTGIDISIIIPQPFIETAPNVAKDPVLALQAAQYINDKMAALEEQHPTRFRWVALLPTNLPSSDANRAIMLTEFERAVDNGAVGACFIVSPTSKPPDHADYMQLYAKAVELDVPLWIHPSRPLNYPDYTQDVPPLSKYFLFLLLDWLLDSSVAMARIAFAGTFDTYPDLKLVIHHKGALVPIFQNRLNYDLYTAIGLATGIPASITQPYIDHFRNFYVDTVFSGNASIEPEITQMSYDFFAPGHVLFGTDAAFSPDNGSVGTLNARFSVEDMKLPAKKLQDIFSNNVLNIIPHK